jgi:hypothetical protein
MRRKVHAEKFMRQHGLGRNKGTPVRQDRKCGIMASSAFAKLKVENERILLSIYFQVPPYRVGFCEMDKCGRGEELVALGG